MKILLFTNLFGGAMKDRRPISLALAAGFLTLAIGAGFGFQRAAVGERPVETFFGQPAPGAEPVKFCPEILTAEKHPHGQMAFSPDGTGVFWSAMLQDGPEQTIYYSAFDGKAFSRPTVAPFAAAKGNGGPAFSADGKRLFFIRSFSEQFVGDQAHFYWVDASILDDLKRKAKDLKAGEIFTPKGRLVTEGRIFGVASHDFDKDGRPDIIVSDYLNPARILYNDAGLEFKNAVPVTLTSETAKTGHGVALGDFNDDGRLDIFLVYNEYPSRLLFGDGKGGFTDSGRAIGTPDLSGTSVEIADVDRDGDLDVFVTYYQERARLYLNDGAGSLAVSDQTFFDGVAVGDLDGDGDADVVSRREGSPASVWLNEKGRFSLQERTIDVGEGIGRLVLIDMDADGDLDLFALGRTARSALWENDGRGSFGRLDQVFDSGTRMAVGAIDLDGKKDLVVGFAVWINTGGGLYEKAQTISLGPVSALELVDIDGDGDLDMLAAGLDRATGRADLLLFMNTLRKR